MAKSSLALRKLLHIAVGPISVVECIVQFLDDRCQLCDEDTGMEVKDGNYHWQWWCMNCYLAVRAQDERLTYWMSQTRYDSPTPGSIIGDEETVGHLSHLDPSSSSSSSSSSSRGSICDEHLG